VETIPVFSLPQLKKILCQRGELLPISIRKRVWLIAKLLKKVSLSEVSDLGPVRSGEGDRAAKH